MLPLLVYFSYPLRLRPYAAPLAVSAVIVASPLTLTLEEIGSEVGEFDGLVPSTKIPMAVPEPDRTLAVRLPVTATLESTKLLSVVPLLVTAMPVASPAGLSTAYPSSGFSFFATLRLMIVALCCNLLVAPATETPTTALLAESPVIVIRLSSASVDLFAATDAPSCTLMPAATMLLPSEV